MRRIIIAAALFVLALTLPLRHAFPHTQWADGEPVPAWVKAQCCGVDDAHHLRPEQVHVMPDGYHVDGYKDVIPEKTLLPSPDGEWWIFYRDYPDHSQSRVYCFFGPSMGT